MNTEKFLFNRIRELRKEKGLTLEQFAERLHVLSGKKFSAVTISYYEKGTYEPAITLLPFIAGALEASVEEFFGSDVDEKISRDQEKAEPKTVEDIEKQVLYWEKYPNKMEGKNSLELLKASLEIHKQQQKEIAALQERLNNIRKFL